jgi:hypothetical protein
MSQRHQKGGGGGGEGGGGVPEGQPLKQFNISIGVEFETWELLFVALGENLQSSSTRDYLTDSKKESPFFELSLPDSQKHKVGRVVITGAGRGTPLPPHNLKRREIPQQQIEFYETLNGIVTLPSGQTKATWMIKCHGKEQKVFSPAISRIQRNKLIGGTEFIIDPLEGERYDVDESNWRSVFMRVLKKALIMTSEAFKKNFIQCDLETDSFPFPPYFHYYFNKDQNLLLIDRRHPETTCRYGQLTKGGFQDIFFIPQVTFGINVSDLVDFLTTICSQIFDERTQTFITRIFENFVNPVNAVFGQDRKTRDFLFLFFYKYVTRTKTKDETDFILRFFLKDFFNELFKEKSKAYRNQLLQVLGQQLPMFRSQQLQNFFESVMLKKEEEKTQQQKIQQQNLKRVNIFGVHDGRVLVEWRDFTKIPFDILQEQAGVARVIEKLGCDTIDYQHAINKRLFTLVRGDGHILKQGQQQQQQQQQGRVVKQRSEGGGAKQG